MLTKDFIKEVEKLGFAVEKGGNGKYLWIKDSRKLFVAFVDTIEMYVFDTAYNAFDELQESDKKNLFNLLVKYASTPSDEREEPQRFYFKSKIKMDCDYYFLNFNKDDDCIENNDIESTDAYQTSFTQKEIDKIKTRFGVTLSDYIQIPVDEYCEEDED